MREFKFGIHGLHFALLFGRYSTTFVQYLYHASGISIDIKTTDFVLVIERFAHLQA
jgi:hypothetical protein